MDLQCLTTACHIFLHVGDLYICIFNKKILWDAVCLQSIRQRYCTAYAIIGGVNPGYAAYNLGNMKPVQLESLFSKKIWLSVLENETQHNWTPMYWILGGPFWKMKPSSTGLPLHYSYLLRNVRWEKWKPVQPTAFFLNRQNWLLREGFCVK